MRTDALALACFGVVVWCLVTVRWPGLALAALLAGLLAGLVPELRGRFSLRLPGAGLSGRFRDRDGGG